MKKTGYANTIADCNHLPQTNLPELAVAPQDDETGEQLWPHLCQEMRAANLVWEQIAPRKVKLAVLRLDLLNTLYTLPGFEAALRSQRILHQAELKRLFSFPQGKRRLEWLGGRLAAKFALQCYCFPPAREIKFEPAKVTISNDSHGRPFLNWVGVSPWCYPQVPFLSITHSGRFAAAMVANTPCGLDLQEIVDKLQRLQTRFASPAEMALGSTYDELIWLGMLWVAKEAVKKCCYADQPTFMDRIQVVGHKKVTHASCDAGTQFAILSCCLTDAAAVVMPVQVAVAQGYAMALVIDADDGGLHA
ncbi:MAG: hypothetical protein GX087_05845 [Desulfobulbaceae bacterium]|nr:hypothetical protein [Desulfobulbaceae bacterium]